MILCCHLLRNVGFFCTGMYMKYGFLLNAYLTYLLCFSDFLCYKLQVRVCKHRFIFFSQQDYTEANEFPTVTYVFQLILHIYCIWLICIYCIQRIYCVKLNARKLSIWCRDFRDFAVQNQPKSRVWCHFVVDFLFVYPFYPLNFLQASVTFKSIQ